MTLSPVATSAVNSQETGEVFLTLLTIAHSLLPSPLYFVNDYNDCTSNGKLFLACPFTLTLPGTSVDAPPTATLTIDNTDEEIVKTIRGLTSPPYITISIVLASQPDVVEMTFSNLRLQTVDYDVHQVKGTLTYYNVLSEPWPGDTVTPSNHPGLF